MRVIESKDIRRLDEIQRELNALHERRTEILAEINDERIEVAKKLEWTKTCDARIHDTGFICAGIPRWKVYVTGKDVPEFDNSVSFTVWGTHRCYEYNVLMNYRDGLGDNRPHFSSYTTKSLLEFFRTTKFNKIEYDSDYLDLLLEVKRQNEK